MTTSAGVLLKGRAETWAIVKGDTCELLQHICMLPEMKYRLLGERGESCRSEVPEWVRKTDLAPDEAAPPWRYSDVGRPWEFQECGHHTARLGPWSAGCGHIRAGAPASPHLCPSPDPSNIPGLGAQDNLN